MLDESCSSPSSFHPLRDNVRGRSGARNIHRLICKAALAYDQHPQAGIVTCIPNRESCSRPSALYPLETVTTETSAYLADGSQLSSRRLRYALSSRIHLVGADH